MREHNFPTTPLGHVITRTGIVIGGGVTRAEEMTRDAEIIQAALLSRPRTLSERLQDAFEVSPYPLIVCIIAGGLVYGICKALAR